MAIPQSRVRDGWQAHAIFQKLVYDDSESEDARARIDAQIDGLPPYSESVMKDAGRGEDANVNFREARAEDDLAQTPFIEMSTVTPVIWRIKTRIGNEDERKKRSAIMSEKFTNMVRGWGEDFDYYRERLAQQFTRHGAGFVYWEDEINWKWRADGFNAFKVPRNTESRSSAIPYCVCKRSISVTDLYAFVRNEKVARELGRWNVDAVRTAIRRAVVTNPSMLDTYSWEDFEREVKENDVEIGCRAEQIQIYHLWVTEYDGTVAHYIGLQDGVALISGAIELPDKRKDKTGMIGNGFLYAHRQRFPSFASAVVPFFYAIGTHATVHTIRAQGEMNFAPISISNRTMCTLVDATRAGSLILMRAENASDVENFAYIQVGGFMVYSGANAKVEPTALPDVTSRILPLLNEMKSLRAQVSPNASVQPPQSGRSKQPETKYSIQAKQNRGSALSSSILTQWFGPFGRVGKEMFRRVMNPNLRQDLPGGKEAFEFRAACMAEGVPAEAMKFENCEVEAVRVIGNGSPEARQYASEQVLELSDRFDESGKKKAVMDAVSAIPGVDYQAAADYVGPLEPRKPVDAQIADTENSIFTLGGSANATGEQNHYVHCEEHQPLVEQFIQAFQQGQIDGQKLISVIKPALDNMLRHLEFMAEDHSREKEAAQFRKFVQNSHGVLEQQENKAIAEMQRQQAAMQQQQGQGGMADPKEQREMEAHAAKMQRMQQEAQMRQQEFNQRLALQQLEAKNRQHLADLKAARDTTLETADLLREGLN